MGSLDEVEGGLKLKKHCSCLHLIFGYEKSQFSEVPLMEEKKQDHELVNKIFLRRMKLSAKVFGINTERLYSLKSTCW